MKSKKVFYGIGWGGLIGVQVTVLASIIIFIFSLISTNWEYVNDLEAVWLFVLSPMTWLIPLIGIPIVFLCSIGGFFAGVISALLQNWVNYPGLSFLNGLVGTGATLIILEFVRLLTTDDWTTNSLREFIQNIVFGNFWGVFLFVIPSLFVIISFALLGKKFHSLTYDEMVE